MRPEGVSVPQEDRGDEGKQARPVERVASAERPQWRVVTVDKNSKVFLEEELKAVMGAIVKVMDKEVAIAKKHIKNLRA